MGVEVRMMQHGDQHGRESKEQITTLSADDLQGFQWIEGHQRMHSHAGGEHTDNNAHSCYVKEGHGVTIPATSAHLVPTATYSQHPIVDNAPMDQHPPLPQTLPPGRAH